MLAFRPKKTFIVISFMLLTLCGFLFKADAQDRMTVDQRIVFKRGTSSALVKKQIRKGTSHQYRIRVSEGQEMTVILTTGKKTSFTISNRIDGIIGGADGEIMWKGMIARSGDYYILIGTDITANYTLEVFVK